VLARYHALYFEDVDSESKEFINLLSRHSIQITPALPPVDLALDAFPRERYLNRYHIILVDYVLSNYKVNDRAIPYSGATLATRVREVFRDRPVLLITTKNRFSKYVRPDSLTVVDDVIFKDDIEADVKASVAKIVGWIQGFQRLSSVKTKNWRNLIKTLGANADEAEKLKETLPPTEKAVFVGKSAKREWDAPPIARWLNRVVLGYPGILYDSLHAATLLGISEESFLSIRVQQFFRDARYSGPFKNMMPRWWRDRILSSAFELIKKYTLGRDVSETFADAFYKDSRKRLKSSVCLDTKTAHADAVCYILRKPVMRNESLEYFPDDRPRIMDTARVSFKAIREKADVQAEFFSREDQRILKQIQKGTIR